MFGGPYLLDSSSFNVMMTKTPPVSAQTSPGTAFRYDRVQRGLHWSMAILILLAIALGLISAYLPVGQSLRRELLDLHKSLGLTVLALIVIRIAYRLFKGVPPYRDALDPLTHVASHLAHAALYVLMLVVPLSGYVFSAAGGYSLPWFGLFQWPNLLPRDKNLSQWGEWVHENAAWIIIGVVALHILAVIWHVTIKRDGVLSRMRGG